MASYDATDASVRAHNQGWIHGPKRPVRTFGMNHCPVILNGFVAATARMGIGWVGICVSLPCPPRVCVAANMSEALRDVKAMSTTRLCRSEHERTLRDVKVAGSFIRTYGSPPGDSVTTALSLE